MAEADQRQRLLSKDKRYVRYSERDLFSMDGTHALAHCVAQDLRMGAGIALHFRKRYGRVDELKEQNILPGGVGVLERIHSPPIFYLVTKEWSSSRPTLDTINESLRSLANICKTLEVKKLAMPLIACGLDRRTWSEILPLIREHFQHTGIMITVCYLPGEKHKLYK